MSNRIERKFHLLKTQNKKAFIAFITAGDPTLKITEELVLAFETVGVDIVELGVPFSDPLADGPTIQAASERALKNKVTLAKVLDTVEHIRKGSQIPIALMTYYNPIFSFGEEKLIERARKAGVDGLIVPDLPPEEAVSLIQRAGKADISTVFFLSPTTTIERIKTITEASTGFIYYVSLTGVTGARKKLPSSIFQNVKTARQFTAKPICVGFGIASVPQVKSIAAIADGVIVGSAIIEEIAKNAGRRDLVENAAQFVSKLTKGL